MLEAAPLGTAMCWSWAAPVYGTAAAPGVTMPDAVCASRGGWEPCGRGVVAASNAPRMAAGLSPEPSCASGDPSPGLVSTLTNLMRSAGERCKPGCAVTTVVVRVVVLWVMVLVMTGEPGALPLLWLLRAAAVRTDAKLPAPDRAMEAACRVLGEALPGEPATSKRCTDRFSEYRVWCSDAAEWCFKLVLQDLTLSLLERCEVLALTIECAVCDDDAGWLFALGDLGGREHPVDADGARRDCNDDETFCDCSLLLVERSLLDPPLDGPRDCSSARAEA